MFDEKREGFPLEFYKELFIGCVTSILGAGKVPFLEKP